MKLVIVISICLIFLTSCKSGLEIPSEFPTPDPPPRSTPLPPLELVRDQELEKEIETIANGASGTVGFAAVLLESGDAAFLNPDRSFPMLSVYKLPIAMAVMEQVRTGRLELEEKVGVTKGEMVRQGIRSPLRDAKPDGGEFEIRELMKLSLSESDGTASDALLRVVGGPEDVMSFLVQIGVLDLTVANNTKEIGADPKLQEVNGASPLSAVGLLRFLQVLADNERENGKGTDLATENSRSGVEEIKPVTEILGFMANSKPGANRLKGLLPKETVVAHKTGTSGTANSVTAATNDIGIIYLPDGRRIAIAVFVANSSADERSREAVIANIGKAVWDKWSNK